MEYRSLASQYREKALASLNPTEPRIAISPSATINRPFDHASYIFGLLKIRELFPSDPPEWLSTFEHLFIIRTALIVIGIPKVNHEATPELEECQDFAAEQLHQFARAHLEVYHPHVTRELWEKLDISSGGH